MSAKVTFDNPSDSIDTLPVDQNPPSHSEIQIMDTLFKQSHSTVQKILNGTKDVMLVGILFMIFSLPQVNEFVFKTFPSAQNSPYILLLAKAIMCMIAYFVIKNMYLVRK